jgi:hypothetical protein
MCAPYNALDTFSSSIEEPASRDPGQNFLIAQSVALNFTPELYTLTLACNQTGVGRDSEEQAKNI